MAKNKEKTYWPHMIMGFFILGITLGYWTVKSASSMPVQKSNEFMMSYHDADLSINEILVKKSAFDKQYTIKLHDKEMVLIEDNVHSNKAQPEQVKLNKGMNSFAYTVETHNGSLVTDANVSFLLTRPHSTAEDLMIDSVPFVNGTYKLNEIEITKPGRYTLQLRAVIGEAIGYSEIPAYLNP